MKYTRNKKQEKSLKLAKQARGTMKAVIEMIEEGTYCPEIIQQADSVLGLLKTLKKELLSSHLDTCVLERMKKNKANTVKELIKIYDLAN